MWDLGFSAGVQILHEHPVKHIFGAGTDSGCNRPGADLMHIAMHTKSKLTTAQAARALGVSKATLLRWIWRGAVPEPNIVFFGGVKYRLFSEANLEHAMRHKRRLHGPGAGVRSRGDCDGK
jgi:excisionase family DNA binding protein